MKIEVTCVSCGSAFLREKSEINRNLKTGRQNYCSLSCVGSNHHEQLREHYGRYKIANHAGNRKDSESKFRFLLRKVKNNSKDRCKECNLSVEDIKAQWDKQGGKCPYTGWSLVTPDRISNDKQCKLSIDRASVDRVDSSKGYTKDNIQIVSIMAQFAKNQFSQEDLIRFCEAVHKQHNTTV